MCLYFLMLKSTRAKCPVKAVSKNNTQILELVELAVLAVDARGTLGIGAYQSMSFLHRTIHKI